MTARPWLAAISIVSAAASPAWALEAPARLVSGVEPRPGMEARASDVPISVDRREPELSASPMEARKPVRVVLPSPYSVQIPSTRP